MIHKNGSYDLEKSKIENDNFQLETNLLGLAKYS